MTRDLLMKIIDGVLTSVSNKDLRDGRFEFPEGVTAIGPGAFRKCNLLVSVSIPEGVTTIGNGAFYYCTHLASVSIPKSLISIGDNVFSMLPSLSDMQVNAETQDKHDKILSSLPENILRKIHNKYQFFIFKITPEDEAKAASLPFPNITPRVMATHTKPLRLAKIEIIVTEELEHSLEILSKFVFLPIQRLLYDMLFSFAKFAASFESMVKLFPDLKSLPVYGVDKPAL